MAVQKNWSWTGPRVYEEWEADGVSWVIQDLPPEDDEEALKLLLEHLVPDETLCCASKITKDPISMQGISDVWRVFLAARMSLACYAQELGKRTLVALNSCYVKVKDDPMDIKIDGEAAVNVFGVLKYMEHKIDEFQYLSSDRLLSAVGLVVKRGYRGNGLAAKVLAAREPLAKSLGVNCTSTVFTGPAAQKSAARAGFHSILDMTLTDLADAGLKYPRNDHVIKLMVKKYSE